ncbi:hypothetical protein ABT160_18770 [Streptomyces sp. NPDC001941]|uniref:STAS domain-containing protein n=1 Tax=Streptomyces sp. NPDC001941 TaxID=3154659 RepID=UPI00332257C3
MIELEGHIDYTFIDDLTTATAAGMAEQHGPIAFRLGEVRGCDSSLLNHFLATRCHRPVMLIAASPSVLHLLEQTGTTEAFELHVDTASALDAA